MYALIASAACAIILMFTAALGGKEKGIASFAAVLLVVLLGCNVADLMAVQQAGGAAFYFNNMLLLDSYVVWINLLMTACVLVYVLLMGRHIRKVGRHVPEYYALIFIILVGLYLLSGYNSLLILFLGIELVSIPQYILAGSDKANLKSSEASLKYFLLGAFSTGIMLMGIALLFGSFNTLNLQLIDFSTPAGNSFMTLAGVLFIIVALGFKVSAAPMHIWTADVYDGAPTPFTALLSTIGKVAPFFAFLRLFHGTFTSGTLNNQWLLVLSIVAAATLLIGNITAVFQQSVKRMLAYSSIAQAGFMLFAVLATNETANAGLVVYAVAYTLASVGMFAVLMKMEDYTYDGFNGLARKEPLLAFFATVFLLSLAGIPLTAGFMAKFYMISALVQQPGMMWLVVFGLLMAAVSSYYYFRVIMAMYFKNGDAVLQAPVENSEKWAMGLTAALIVVIGAAPQVILFWIA